VKKWPAAVQLLIVGFYVAFSLLIPTGLGFWLDLKTEYKFPLYTLIGLGVGTLIMVYGVYRMVRPFLQEAKREQGGASSVKRGSPSVVDDETAHRSEPPHEEIEEEE